MRISPFRGIRYSAQQQAGPLAGPPYDQIDIDLQRQLHRESQHFAHLIRPAESLGGAHRAAAALHQQWLDSHVLTIDATPTLYPYEIQLAAGGRRLGLCALVGLEDAESGVIRPHEATVAKTVDERLSLLRQTQIDLEPILMLADDKGGLNRLLEEDLLSSTPLVQHEDDTGSRHHLYQIADPQRLADYREALSSSVGLIADGHHRYTVASRYAQEIHAAPGTAAASKLTVITSLASPGLQIDPIHRRLEQSVDVESVAALATSHHSLTSGSGVEIAAAVAATPQPAIGVTVGSRTEVWRFDGASPSTPLPEHLRHLSVGWLHDVLLPGLGLPSGAATDGTLTYRSDPHRLLAELLEGSAAVGFWLPPMSGEDFARAMEGGSLLPPKSTRFLPKVASGMVWASHDTALS